MRHLEFLLGQRLPRELLWKAYRLEAVSSASAEPTEQLCRWHYSYPHPCLTTLVVAVHARLAPWKWRLQGLAPT